MSLRLEAWPDVAKATLARAAADQLFACASSLADLAIS